MNTRIMHRRYLQSAQRIQTIIPAGCRRIGSLTIVLLTACVALGLLAIQQLGAPGQSKTVQTAWARARSAGSYQFAGDIVQVTTPGSTVTNVGRTSQTNQLYIEGKTSLREQLAEMQLWAQDGTVAQSQSGIGVRVERGKTYVRAGSGAWQERPSFADGFAPQGDVMAYLTAARDVTARAPETRAGVTFTRLTFRLDGPAFAAYMRDQMEQALRQKEAVPPGVQFDMPAYYRDMVGSGELWVGQDGLPIRQMLSLRFPEQQGESVSAQITINFSDFGQPAIGFGILGALPSYLPNPSAELALLLTLAFAWLLIRFHRSRRMRKSVALMLIVSIVFGPLLQSAKTRSFLVTQAAQAASQNTDRAAQKQARKVQAGLATSSFDPHADPLAAPARTQNAPSNPGSARAASAQAAPPDNGTDTDGDGLTDYQELRIGTDPTFADTDEDGIPDAVEVRGFQFGGKTWYLNPNSVDSNGDGIADGLECWKSPPPANTPPNQVPPCDLDTDGDGIPDVFDNDNDNDGVPDALDLAPFTRSTQTFSEASPLSLKVNNLTAGKPTFVDFQLRPANEKRLWFAFNVLDWPQGDSLGQVRDIDGKTFADVARAQGRTPGANESFGDMKLIPMLEIRIPASSANLPPQSDLTPYNITVNNFTADGATKVVYVPLSLVTDEKTGMRVAFSGRMRYLPTGNWPTPQQVRLAWVVQTLVDMPCDPKAANAAQQGCGADGYMRNVPQVVQTYYDDWTLTGLNVKEDNGASVAIAYEDPAVDGNLKDEPALTALSAGLDNAFLSARDQDGNGQRDVDLAEIVRRFNRTTNAGVSEDERWAIPNILRVERQDYATFDQALSSTTMTETVRILNRQFATPWQSDNTIKPLLLYAQEARARAVGLDGIKASGGYVALSGNNLTVDFAPAGQAPTPLLVTNRLQWTPYCASGGSAPAWSPCDTETWWNELERRSPTTEVLPGDNPADTNLAAGRVLIMNIYATQLINGLSRVVQQDNKLISGTYTLQSDPKYASLVRSLLSGGSAVVKKVANTVIMARFVNQVPVLEYLGNTFKAMRGGTVGTILKTVGNIFLDFRTGGNLNRLAGTGIVLGAAVLLAGLATILAYNFLTDNLGGKIAFKVLVIGIMTFVSVVSPILTIKEWSGVLRAAGSTTSALTLSNEVAGTAKAAGVIGTVIAVAATWGFFIYSIVSNKVSAFSPEFNRALAETIAATIYIVLLFVLSATLIGALLVGIVGIIDSILTAICELGVDALRTVPGLGGSCFTLGNAAIKGLTYSLYNYSPMIDVGRSDLVATGAPNVQLADPSRGFTPGNMLTISMPITTTIVHKDPDPKDGLLIYPYMWLYSQDSLRSSTFKYGLGAGNVNPPDITASRGEMSSAWQGVREDHKYLASPMYRGQANTTPPPVTGIPLSAGLNQTIPLSLKMAYAIPAYECWGLLILGACYRRQLADTNTSSLEPLRFDVFPATLDGFMALTARGSGQALAWSPQFPALKDADGDGLIAASQGGLDPNDTKPDTDGDGLADSYELDRRAQGVAYNPSKCDTDGDGLTDAQEARLGTNPAVADTDGDGLTDGQEVWHERYDPVTCQPTGIWEGGWDVVVDGATPLTVRVSSNPLLADSDNDGLSDSAERQLASDPNPANRVDSQGYPYNPNVFNTPPIAVFTSVDDADGIVGLNQTFAYTTTVVTHVALNPSPLNVTLPQGLGNTTLNYTLGFNPLTFTTAQTVTQQSQVTVAANAGSGPRTITSQVLGQLAGGGQITASGSQAVTIDGTPPSSTITSLQNGQYIQGSAPGKPTTVIIGGSASDAGSGISRVEVRVNNGPWQAADGRTTWTYPLTVEDGLYDIQTRATDGAGNVETPGAGITVRADGFPPEFNFLAVPTKPIIPARTVSGLWSVAVGGFISDPQIGFFRGNGTIANGSGVVPESVKVRVRLKDDPASINTWQPVAIANGQWSANYLFPASVADPTGTYWVELQATDAVGNQWQDGENLLLDAAAPRVAMSAQDSTRPSISDTITVGGVISDANSLVGIDSLEASFAPLDQVVPLSDAVLRLPFDEAAGSVYYPDISGYGNSAVCGQEPSCPTAGSAGRVDRALAFNAAQPLRVADAASLNFGDQRSFSVQGWIKTAQADAVILRKGSGAQYYRLGLSGGVASFDLGNGTMQTQVSGSPALNDNQWHFVVGTVDRATGKATLYVDGVLRGSKAVSGSFASADALQIGGQSMLIGQPPIFLIGALDEITIVAHALSAAEVRALYAAADRQWLPATLAQRGTGVSSATWSLPIPAGLEGEYQLDLRSQDMLGNRAVTPKLWRGVIDTRAPRVVLTAKPTGAVYFDTAANTYRAAVSYVCGAQDQYLSEASFTCPGTNLPPPTRSFDGDPIMQSLFPDLTIRSGLGISYTVWEAVGQITRTAKACDIFGKCTTVDTPVNLASAVPGAPRAVVIAPADQSFVASSGAVSVIVAAEADQPLKEVTLTLDGTVVDTATFAQADTVRRNQRMISVTPSGEGAHTLVARATDWTGRVQTTLVPVVFTLDTQPPSVTLDDSPLTVTDTYGLRSNILRFNGTANDTVGLAAVQISVNGKPFADTTFGNGTWRTALSVTDPEGKLLSVTVRAIDLAGHVTEITRNIQVNLSTANPPDTTITASPPDPSSTTTASFSFTGTPGERGIGGYECQLDDGAFLPCASQQVYTGLSKGTHTFRVRAIDSQGYVDPSPASYTWTIIDASATTPTPTVPTPPVPTPSVPTPTVSSRQAFIYLPLLSR